MATLSTSISLSAEKMSDSLYFDLESIEKTVTGILGVSCNQEDNIHFFIVSKLDQNKGIAQNHFVFVLASTVVHDD